MFSSRSLHSTFMQSEQVLEFLKNPIDSRCEETVAELRPTITSSRSIFNQPTQNIINEDEIRKEWEKRLGNIRKPSRIYEQKPIIVEPNLMLRQTATHQDPLNRLSVEQISKSRAKSHMMNKKKNGILPKARKIPTYMRSVPFSHCTCRPI